MASNFKTSGTDIDNVLLARSYTNLDGLQVWGANNFGQLGIGNTTNKSNLQQVSSTTDWKSLEDRSTHSNHSLAIKTDGTLWAWGRNNNGQLGLGDLIHRSSPVQVGSLTNWSYIVTSPNSSLAIKTDGTLWAWGGDGRQLGLSGVTTSSPIQVGTLTNWKEIAVGYGSTQAIKTDGTLWVWGYNAYGMGNGTTTSYNSPVQVGTSTNWKSVASGQEHTLVIKTDGTLWGWGHNMQGDLGLNSTATYAYSSPVQIGSLPNWSIIEAGGNASYAIKTDGTLWAWGGDVSSYGKLGLGTGSKSSPTQVGTLTNWKDIDAGLNHAVALKTDGTLWAWGYNLTGELGLGDITNRSSPVQVGTATTWKQISASDSFTKGIK